MENEAVEWVREALGLFGAVDQRKEIHNFIINKMIGRIGIGNL